MDKKCKMLDKWYGVLNDSIFNFLENSSCFNCIFGIISKRLISSVLKKLMCLIYIFHIKQFYLRAKSFNIFFIELTNI